MLLHNGNKIDSVPVDHSVSSLNVLKTQTFFWNLFSIANTTGKYVVT